ncbi:mevalonate kinase [Agaribacterium sp. ZY112]|uniref:mevalonate kinase n=1 Tax=Agaribacterium sp. ZY112 TaxID=3233574 RepID=UPI00352587EA
MSEAVLEFSALKKRKASTYQDAGGWVSACAKVILFGEHSVVYGQPAIAGGLEQAIRVRIESTADVSRIVIPAWRLDCELAEQSTQSGGVNLLQQSMTLLFNEFALTEPVLIRVEAEVPHASGLGASAALAVACARAVALFVGQDPSNERINDLAYQCETLAHGRPSGLDNTIACYGGLFRFQKKSEELVLEPLSIPRPLRFLVALSGVKGFTAKTVERVRQAWLAKPDMYNPLFASMGALVAKAEVALKAGDLQTLAVLMTENQACLRQLGVSCAEIDEILHLATQAGALAGKLTGSGDGGAVLLCCGSDKAELEAQVQATLEANAYLSFPVVLAN